MYVHKSIEVLTHFSEITAIKIPLLKHLNFYFPNIKGMQGSIQ